MLGKTLLIKQKIGWLSSDFKDRNSKGKKEAGLKHGLKLHKEKLENITKLIN